MLPAAEDYSLKRADVVVIATPGEEDVKFIWNLIVCRVEVDPTGVAAKKTHPCVCGIGPD